MSSAEKDSNDLFKAAVANLEPGKPVIFTNLLRFRSEANYAESSLPANMSFPTPCSGEEAYFRRYFPLYHAAARDVYGDEATIVQKVLYTGKRLMPLTIPRNAGGEDNIRDGYWHAVVMTKVQSWDVVTKISTSEIYQQQATYHRTAAVEDDVLFVSNDADAAE